MTYEQVRIKCSCGAFFYDVAAYKVHQWWSPGCEVKA